MLNQRYAEASVEVLDILEHMDPNDLVKVSNKFIDFLKENASREYMCNLDYSKKLNEMNLKEETRGLLALMYENYWCPEEEKQDLQKKFYENEQKYQEKCEKNKQNIETVEAKSLPVGILNDVDFSVFDKDMRDGDIFIMCSDGILDSNPDQDDDKWLLKLIKEINTNNVKKMADIILNEAIDNGYGILKDDMSVIVAKVVKI